MRPAMKLLAPLALFAVSACAVAEGGSRVAAPGVAPPLATAGLERVLGQNAAALTQLFGNADAEVREGAGSKLQFESQLCVLDAYLYPKGSAEPRVTYVDARQPDGSPIDRASCVAAMTRRRGAR